MNTVILKWNPSFSSYSMLDYLSDIRIMTLEGKRDFDWSVWDYDKIHAGDRFYWLKVGMYGQTGIVGRGTITSEPYEERDWSGRGRKTFYVAYTPELLVNPDALPVLTSAELNHEIPGFEWTGGHSGLILSAEQAERLDALWSKYVLRNVAEFEKAASLERGSKDLIYSQKFNERNPQRR